MTAIIRARRGWWNLNGCGGGGTKKKEKREWYLRRARGRRGNLISPAKRWKSSHFIVFATYKFYILPPLLRPVPTPIRAGGGWGGGKEETQQEPCSCILYAPERPAADPYLYWKQKTAPPEKCGPLALVNGFCTLWSTHKNDFITSRLPASPLYPAESRAGRNFRL